MNLSFSGVFAEARALWQRERILLVAVAAVFLFLPCLSAQFFLPLPDLGKADGREAMSEAILAWFNVYGGWFMLELVVITYGAGALLVLLLDPARPTAGASLIRALRLLPSLLIVWTCALLLISLGSTLLLVVAFYIAGRLLLAGPALVAGPGVGPIRALIDGVKLSHRRGWMLSAVAIVTFGAGQVAQLIPGMLIGALAASGTAQPLLLAPLEILAAAAAAAGWLALVIVQAAAYRLARQGM
ncbi:MAG: hypothetical protein EOP59_08065 [Sphingomonadales bacterium]|nr:MAG: hypothetical protein EOP59_08065 [Sphingomonadales bacterium]